MKRINIIGIIILINSMAFAQDEKAKVDFEGFKQVSLEAEEHRASRLVDIDKFTKMAEDSKTIILDTRSRAMYEMKHVKGAVHLNFSDFTADKLAELIPNKETRILIYCNNNFMDDPIYMALKSPPLALNIPTYINLYGYGYKNVFELDGFISIGSGQLKMEGKAK